MRVHNAHRGRRGNALPETALTITFVLLVFLGLIKVMFVGFEQAEADGAAFVAANAASLTTVETTSNPSVQDQAARGFAKAKAIFSDYPNSQTQSIQVFDGTPVSSTNLGYVVAQTTRVAGGLMLGQGFGGGPGQIDLHAQIVEPVTFSPQPTSPVQVTVSPAPPNCLDNPGSPLTTNNATGPNTPWQCSLVLAAPTSSPNPLYQYECHLAYYASLVQNGDGVTLSQVDTSTYGSIDTGALTNSAGQTLGQHPWPTEYQTATGGSINDPDVRNAGRFLTTQSPQQNIGGGASGGLLGTQLIPIFMFGQPSSSGYSDPCAS
jgi:hypothetical protein